MYIVVALQCGSLIILNIVLLLLLSVTSELEKQDRMHVVNEHRDKHQVENDKRQRR